MSCALSFGKRWAAAAINLFLTANHMHQPACIAIFRPPDQELARVHAVLSRHGDQILVVDSLEDLRSSAHSEGRSPDVIAVCSRLATGASGMSVCLGLKADPLFSSVPLLALALARDLASIEALFSYGADVVVQPPFDPEVMHLQLEALVRQRRAFNEALAGARNELDLTQAGMEALDCTREGLVVFRADRQPIFANYSARTLLALPDDEPVGRLAHLASLLTGEAPQGLTRRSLTRCTGQRFTALVRLLSIPGSGQAQAGFAVGILDAGEVDQLHATLLQAQRLRDFALLCSATVSNLLHGQPGLADRMRQLLNAEQPGCLVDAVALSLLELFDSVMNPGITTRIDLPRDCRVALPFGDTFRLLGTLLLQAVEHAGLSGEVTMTGKNTATGSVRIEIISECRSYEPLVRDYLSDLIQGFLGPPDKGGGMTFTAVEAAQKLAESYDASVEFKHRGAQLKLRVDLELEEP